MHVFTLNGVRIECGLAVMLLIPAAIAFDVLDQMLLLFVSLSLHELSHAYMARRLGAVVYSVEIQPFGFCARLKDGVKLSPGAELLIAMAGPAFSVMAALSGMGIFSAFGKELPLLEDFIGINAAVAAVNLVPVSVLDGGMALKAILSVYVSRSRAVKITGYAGIAVSVLLIAAGTYLFIGGGGFSMPLFGVFLFFASIKEIRRANMADVGRIAAHRRLSGGGMRVRQLAFHRSTRLFCVLSELHYGSYNSIVILDDDMRGIYTVDESTLLSAAEKLGANAQLFDLIPK